MHRFHLSNTQKLRSIGKHAQHAIALHLSNSRIFSDKTDETELISDGCEPIQFDALAALRAATGKTDAELKAETQRTTMVAVAASDCDLLISVGIGQGKMVVAMASFIYEQKITV